MTGLTIKKSGFETPFGLTPGSSSKMPGGQFFSKKDGDKFNAVHLPSSFFAPTPESA